MSHSTKYRERTLEYKQAGQRLEQPTRSSRWRNHNTKWEKQLKETGNVEKKEREFPKNRSEKAESISIQTHIGRK